MGHADLLSRLETAVKEQAVPFLAPLATPVDAARVAEEHARATGDPYAMQAAAYLRALAGTVPDALVLLDALRAKLDAAVPWQRRMAADAAALAEEARRGSAQELLSAWEDETVAMLGLVQLCAAADRRGPGRSRPKS